MHSEYDSLGESGLQFFGKVSASIAHEIKNVLAIINENAGLLEDLTFAAQKGAAIDPDRLNRVCLQFNKQILRADEILKNMSRFAHSVDRFEGQVDLHELAVLVSNLAGRPAAMRKLSIVVEPPATPIIAKNNPFLVQNLIWLCLESAFGATTAGGTLRLAAERNDGRSGLRICGIDGLTEDFAAQLPAVCADLLDASGAKLIVDSVKKDLNLVLT
ncbi:MAG: hypothetical protein A2X81_14320 [Desulfobacterales bacterium GWB2_56_26]|nr:MAG: hypothetical protein A2X81_14320 [Desulfobacterales bacterium GWB2_56_26]